MKFLKVSAIAFIATFIIASIGVNASYAFHGYAGISLPALKGTTTWGPHTKTETGLQYYENTGTVNMCTGNENGVQVAVKSEAAGQSAWLVLANSGQSGAWANNNKTTVKRAYNIKMKNNTSSPCTASHSGTWYLDKSAYDLTH
jgi:hypothetical protein